MYLKIHRTADGNEIVAVCDRELLNTTLTEGEVEIHISSGFYGDHTAGPDEVRTALKHADNANIMGERSVNLAIEIGIVDRSGCIWIGGVPHAQIFRI
jgi:hypothetical protein